MVNASNKIKEVMKVVQKNPSAKTVWNFKYSRNGNTKLLLSSYSNYQTILSELNSI